MLNRSNGWVLLILLTICLTGSIVWAECKQCAEVAKEAIPAEYLDPSVKIHPAGFSIWDEQEAILALKNDDKKYLWVDTRPKSFYKLGSVKNACHMVCDQKGVMVPEKQHGPELTQERLLKAIGELDPKASDVTVVFFCQGPKCHRSYNAALRAVNDYGLDPSKIIWFRAGYPHLEKYIMENPKLKRRLDRYLQGDVINS